MKKGLIATGATLKIWSMKNEGLQFWEKDDEGFDAEVLDLEKLDNNRVYYVQISSNKEHVHIQEVEWMWVSPIDDVDWNDRLEVL